MKYKHDRRYLYARETRAYEDGKQTSELVIVPVTRRNQSDGTQLREAQVDS